MKNSKKFLSLLLCFVLSISFNLTTLASEYPIDNNYDSEAQITNLPNVNIGSRIGYGEAYNKGTVRVYVTLNRSYSKGIVVRAGAVGNDTPFSCSVIYPDGTPRVLCSQELEGLRANGGRTDYFYISNGAAGTYEFIFTMEDTTKTTGCLAWIYEVT